MGIRILLVDDHPLIGRGIRDLLSQQDHIESVDFMGDGDSAWHALAHHHYELVLTDISMPGKDGLTLVHEGTSLCPRTKFVVLTFHNDGTLIEKAFQFGASGFVLKEDSEDEILRCIDIVSRGGIFTSKGINFQITNNCLASSEELTPTEKIIIGLVGQYFTSKEIANKLSVSVRTVQNHRANIVKKLNISGSNALLRYAQNSSTQNVSGK